MSESESGKIHVNVGVTHSYTGKQREDNVDVERSVFVAARRGKRVGDDAACGCRAAGVGEEGREVDFYVHTAQQFGGQIHHTAVEPEFKRRHGVGPRKQSEIEIGVEKPRRVEFDSAGGGVRDDERSEVDVRRQFENGIAVDTLFRESREQVKHYIVAVVTEFEEISADCVDVDSERQIHAHGTDVGENVRHAHVRDVEQLRESKQVGVLVVGIGGTDSRKGVFVGFRVTDGAHSHAEAESDVRKSLETAVAVVDAESQTRDVDCLGFAETGVCILQSYVAHKRQSSVHAGKTENAVDNLFGKGDADTLDIEDISVHIDLDGAEYCLNEADGVEVRGFVAAGRSDIVLDVIAVRDGFGDGRVVFSLRGLLCAAGKPRYGVAYGYEQTVYLLGQEFVEIEVADLYLRVSAENAAEVGKQSLFGADISDGAAHLAVLSRNGDEKVGLRGVTHIYLGGNIERESEGGVLLNVDVEGLERVGNGNVAEQRAERRENGLDFETVLPEVEIEFEPEFEGKRGILVEIVDVEFSDGNEIIPDVENGSVLADGDFVDAEIDVEFALDNADAVLKGSARGVEVEAYLEGGTAHEAVDAVVAFPDGGNHINRGSVHEGGQHREVETENIAYLVDEFAVGTEKSAGLEETAHNTEEGSNVDGNLILDGAVGSRNHTGILAHKDTEETLDGAELTEFYAEKVVDDEASDAGAAESGVDRLGNRGEVEVVGLHHAGTLFDFGAVVNDGAVVVIEPEHHFADITVGGSSQQFDEQLRIIVVSGVYGSLELNGIVATALVLDVIQPERQPEVEVVAGVCIERRFPESRISRRARN